jgi:hypothetical protein
MVTEIHVCRRRAFPTGTQALFDLSTGTQTMFDLSTGTQNFCLLFSYNWTSIKHGLSV